MTACGAPHARGNGRRGGREVRPGDEVAATPRATTASRWPALRRCARSLRRRWPRNGEITAPAVHLAGPDGRLEPVAIDEALARAAAAGLDLVAVGEGAPPTCRLLPPQKPESRDDRGKKFHDPLAASCAIDV